MKSFILSMTVLLLLSCAQQQVTQTSENITGKKTVKLKIEGMTWRTNCVLRVTKALQETANVDLVNIDYENKIATVVGNDSLQEKDLIESLAKTNRYSGTLIKE